MKKNLRFLPNFLLSLVLFASCTFSAFAQNWDQIIKVAASDRARPATSVNSYGRSVAISGDYAFSGGVGTVIIAKYVNNDWVNIARLTVPGDAEFGRSVSVSEGYLLVSGSLGAYIYKQNAASPDNWVFLKKLFSSNQYGLIVSIHGNNAIVGSSYESITEPGQEPSLSTGAVYIFEKGNGGPDNWGQIKKIKAPVVPVEYTEHIYFGLSVAISDDYVLVGSTTEVTIYRKDKGAPGNWGFIQTVVGTPVNNQDDVEYRSVAIEGEYAVIGTPNEDSGDDPDDKGAAYIFKKDANNADNWNLLQKIQQLELSDNSGFGRTVAIEGAFIVVGASSYNEGDGAVCVFKKASDGTDRWGSGKSLDVYSNYTSHFGASVAISGDKITAGAPNKSYDHDGYHEVDGYGDTYFFSKDYGGAEAWGQDTVLSLHNFRNLGGGLFGYSVAISGDYAVVGKPGNVTDQGEEPPITNTGAAYILHNNAGHWEEVKKILPPVSYEWGQFGSVVDIDGDNILISRDADENDNNGTPGNVYLFSKNQGGTDNWGLVKTFAADKPASYDTFGKSVSISGNYAIAGAPLDGNHTNPATNYSILPGAVYIFEKNTGGTDNWGLLKKIADPDPVNGSKFGDLVDIDGNLLLASDKGGRGSLYVFGKDTGGTDQWGLVKKITNLSTEIPEQYRARISLSGNNALLYNVEGKLQMFGKNQGGSNNWGLVKELVVPSNITFRGNSVSISSEYAVLSAYGSAYIYKKDQGGQNQWGFVQTITPTVPTNNSYLGHSAAIDGNTILVGAPYDDLDADESNPSGDAGSVYFYENTPRSAANVRINAGGADFQASDGREFIADQYYEGITRVSTIPDTDILNTTDDALYFNKRLAPSFNYKVPVMNGTVKVVLHFAEIYWGINGRKGLGKRKFHVDIEGSRKLTDYEIIAEAGAPLTAIQESFVVTVTDGILNIDFLSGAADMPAISAIEVLPAEYTTLSTEIDSYVRSGRFADDNYGQDITMQLKKSPAEGYTRESYLKFPLNNITSVNSAKLRIYGSHVDNTNRVTLLTYGVTDDSWTENGITWNNAPASSGSVLGKDRILNYSGYFEIDVTSFIKSELAGDKVVSLVLKAGQNDQLILNSSENAVSPPKLIIETLLADNPTVATRTGEKEELIKVELIAEAKPEPTVSRVFPNPARKKFQIAVSDRHKGKVDLQLTSLSGRTYELARSASRNNASEIDVDLSSMQLAQGIYILKIHSVAATETMKLMVME